MEDKRTNPFEDLTPREHQVLSLIIRGLKRSESPQQTSECDINEVDADVKAKPMSKE